MKLKLLIASLLSALPFVEAADIKTAWGTGGQALTCTLASLANNGARACTAVDNSTNKFVRAKFFLKVKSGASSTSATGYVDLFAGGSVNGGTTYTENFGGTDAAFTFTVPPNIKWIGTCNVVVDATTYYCGPFPVELAFGGTLPTNWFIVISNKSGGTLDSTEGNHAKLWQGEYVTVQ